MQKLFKALKKWYKGELVFPKNDPSSAVIRLGYSHRRHWTAQITRKVVNFHKKEWKWALPFYVGLIALLIKI